MNGTEPTRVAVVRPKRTGAELFGRLLGAIAGTFLVAWIVMLIAGVLTPLDLSYWHSLLALIGLRLLQNGSGWMQWTHEATR